MSLFNEIFSRFDQAVEIRLGYFGENCNGVLIHIDF